MGKFIDITGQRFGFWLVVGKAEKSNSGQTQWICKCDCGTQKIVTSNSLRTSNSTSCGCNHKPNLVGEKFGKLTVTALDIQKNKNRRYWICTCTCNNTLSVSTYKLRNNITTSCGCENSVFLEKNHSNECLCQQDTVSREDCPNPNSFYSPKHVELMYRCQERTQKLQKLYLEIKKQKERIADQTLQIRSKIYNLP